MPNSTEGQEHVPSVVGPLARSLSSIIAVTKELIKSEQWLYDAKVHRIPWRQDEFEDIQSRPLVIGVILDDGVVKVHPPTERVVREVCSKLEQAGHEVVPWAVSGHKECIAIMVRQAPFDSISAKPILIHCQGPILSCRWWRGYPAISQRWRRALHSTCGSSSRSCQDWGTLSVRILAAERSEACCPTSESQKMDGLQKSVRAEG